MMKTILQITTLSGNLIDEAKWEIDFTIQPMESHEISLNFETNDSKLISFINANERSGIVLDGDPENGYNMSMRFDIKKIKHLVDVSTKEVDTYILLSPPNRTLEQIILYVLNSKYCNGNFLKILKS